MKSISDLINLIKLSVHSRSIYNPISLHIYHLYQNYKIKRIRNKAKIKVLFIIGEASTWKSEELYLTMLGHPRFYPILGVTESMHVPGSKEILIDYLNGKRYDFIDLDTNGNEIKKIDPDIKFYYKPYELNYRHGIYFDYNMKSIVCSLNYGFSASGGKIAFQHEIKKYAWRDFVENEAVVKAVKDASRYAGNKIVTGIPLQDFLSLPKEKCKDPWYPDRSKKRIIYAPHHSFKGYNGEFIEYATFLEFGEFMLGMAKKYANEVQWVFKPHPSLKLKLIKIWGEERTQEYYDAWASLPNAQLKVGAYNDIFAYSDAMIHDCSSFIVEYQYTHNPILFLEEKHRTAEEMFLNGYGYEAYKVHYHASTKQQIEDFIQSVIRGEDSMKEERDVFFNKYMTIPNGKSACENIIDVILGTN